MKVLFEHVLEEEEKCLVIGGDCNTRTGNKVIRSRLIGEKKEERHEIKNSLDKVINKEGQILLGKLNKRR